MNESTTKPSGKYIVVNPRGIPKGTPIFRQGEKTYREGDTYDGDSPAEPLRRGFIQEVKNG